MSGVEVEVLHTETCSTWRAAASRIRTLAGRAGIAVDLAVTTIETPDEAVERRFLGSPTVRVGGRDVQPEAERLGDFGLGRRSYPGPGGSGGVPSAELLLAALRAAAGRRLAGQRQHWSDVLGSRADRFGTAASAPAEHAAELFARAGARDLLELGAGQGRDSLSFARRGFNVQALDFADSGVQAIRAKALEARLQDSLRACTHDCREPLPFAAGSFDACYSHMLFCMALTNDQLVALSAEVLRVLRPGGIHVYTVRSTADPDCGAGVACGDGLYESSGFIVHFFSRELVERLARGFELVEVAEFEEGDLPRRLFRVTLVKPAP